MISRENQKFIDQDELRAAEDIHKYISSKTPDPVSHPDLCALVMTQSKYMTHGPFGINRECIKRGLKIFKRDIELTKKFCEEN